MRATATIVRGEDRQDVAVPPGTTVAGLLAMLHVDASDADLAVALPDGRPAGLGSVIGDDLPSGVLLAVTGVRASAATADRAVEASGEARFSAAVAATAGVGFSAALGLAAVVAPLALPDAMPVWVRLAAAALALATAMPLARRRPFASSPGGALVLPGLLGLPFAVVVPPATTGAVPVSLAVGLIAAALAAGVLWLRTGGPQASAAAALWGSVAVLVPVAIMLGAGTGLLAPALLAATVVAVQLAPRYAVTVPEAQLLDLPLVTTSAPTVRAPEVPPPSRVTRRRVAGTIDRATALTDTATLGACALAGPAGLLAVGVADPATLSGQATLATVGVAVVALALAPRTTRSGLVRSAPRVAAALLLAGAAAVLAVRGLVGVPVLAAALALVATAVPLGTVAATAGPASPLLGRLADLAQGLALAALVPGALLSAGLFDVVRELAS